MEFILWSKNVSKTAIDFHIDNKHFVNVLFFGHFDQTFVNVLFLGHLNVYISDYLNYQFLGKSSAVLIQFVRKSNKENI